MWDFLKEAWSWGGSVGLPIILGLVCLGAAIWARIHLSTYLPLIGNGVSVVLAVAGAWLIGYGQGSDATRDAAREKALVAQAEAMQEANQQLRAALVNATLLQDRIASFSKDQQEFAATQRGQTDEFIQRLQSIPVSADCSYSPDTRKRLLNIHIRRPAPRGSANPPG